ncbi:MAG: hypothetical protein ACYDEX_16415 [Mobilitalea sp.]
MVGNNEAFIDVIEICRMLGIGKTKAYAIISTYNQELRAKGFLTIRGRCPRKYFEQKIYGYSDYYNPEEDLEKYQLKVAEDGSFKTREKVLTD